MSARYKSIIFAAQYSLIICDTKHAIPDVLDETNATW
jgi:hypothetical protein